MRWMEEDLREWGGGENVHEVGEIQKGEIVDSLEGVQKEF